MLYICFGIMLAVIAFDQITKIAFTNASCGFIDGFIRFDYSENRGMAWGLFNDIEGATIFLAIFSVIVAGFMIYLLVRYGKSLSSLLMIALSLVIAGALGNIIDRIFLGYVRDFIVTEFMEFPSFNIADSAVTVGGIITVIIFLFTKKGGKILDMIFEPKKKPAVEKSADAELSEE